VTKKASSELVAEAPEVFGAPKEVLKVESNAYSAELVFDGPDALLLTARALYRVRPNGELETHPASLGLRPVAANSFLFFWEDGWFYKSGKRGGPRSRWFREAGEPVWTRATHDTPVWVRTNKTGEHIVRIRDGHESTDLYQTSSRIVALTLLGGRAFFVEAAPNGSWRFVSVGLDPKDAPPQFSPARSDRPPALLVPWEDALIYYAGLKGGVRAESPDFLRDRPVKLDWICSPLTVANAYAFCASVDGIGAVSLAGAPASWKKVVLPGPIVHIAANGQQLAWVLDLGDDRLSVMLAQTALNQTTEVP
jgi:hypothetical protein